MNLVSTSWSCVRCGAAFISTPPEHGLCDQCLADLEMLAQLAPIANQPCPLCGGPVCADCGKALVTLIPVPGTSPGPFGEVSGDGGFGDRSVAAVPGERLRPTVWAYCASRGSGVRAP